MRTGIDCIACVFRQALSAARHATGDPRLHEQVLRRLAAHYADRPLGATPAHFSHDAYEIVADVTGVRDPFADEKVKFNELALAMVPECEAAIAAADDMLATGAHLAVAGNIIDLGIAERLDIRGTLANALHVPFAVNDLERLRPKLADSRSLLYIGDNAGEIVFDRLFIEIIQALHAGLEVTFTVKSGPIINDATRVDADAVGMTDVCDVIEIGGAYIGAPLDRVSDEFLERLRSADVIISKGQGNFETLSGATDLPIFFILKAKCELVAEELGVAFGDSVLRDVRRERKRHGRTRAGRD